MTEQHDAFWATFLGVSVSVWNVPGTSVSAHVGLSGFRGVWFFRRLDRLVVSAPSAWLPHLARMLAHEACSPDDLDEARLRELFGDDYVQSIGPAFQGALSPSRFTAVGSGEARAVAPEDSAAVARFQAECGESDVSDSGLNRAPLYQTACRDADSIVAMAGFREWGDVAGGPCVLTHPAHRGRGHGASVASATVQSALEARKLLLYQTLESNTASVRLARRLGYEKYARHIAVRLSADAPSAPR